MGEAMLRPEAAGKRFVLDGDEPFFAVNDIIQRCRELYPQYEFDDAPGPKLWNDKFLPPVRFQKSGSDNSFSKTVLGLKYISAEQTFRDTVESIVNGKFVPVRLRSRI